MLKEVLKHIEQRNRFVLTSHARPDGDAIGSALACRQILRAMGKEADVVLRDGVPRIYQPLPYAREVVQSETVNGDYEAAIILECDSIQRTRLQGLENKFLINIDHHLSGRPFAQVNWIDPKAVATAEMVYRLAREAGVKISPEIATCLYTAVLTDTGSFMFEGTNEHTFELARELVLGRSRPGPLRAQYLFWTLHCQNAVAGRGAFQPAPGRVAGVDLRDPGTDAALPCQGRRLRRAGELRALHAGCGSGVVFPRACPMAASA